MIKKCVYGLFISVSSIPAMHTKIISYTHENTVVYKSDVEDITAYRQKRNAAILEKIKLEMALEAVKVNSSYDYVANIGIRGVEMLREHRGISDHLVKNETRFCCSCPVGFFDFLVKIMCCRMR
jgi:hypothetical protein